jgi:hypothetical protein
MRARRAASAVRGIGSLHCTQTSGVGLCMQKRTAFGEYRTAVMHEEDLYVRCGGLTRPCLATGGWWLVASDGWLGARQSRRQAAHGTWIC